MTKSIKSGSSISKRGTSSSKKKSISTMSVVKSSSSSLSPNNATNFNRAKIIFATMLRDQIDSDKLSKETGQDFLDYKTSKEKIVALEELKSLDKLTIQKILRFLRDPSRRITAIKILAYNELIDYYEDLELESPRASNVFLKATIIDNIEHYDNDQDRKLDLLMKRFPKAWNASLAMGYKDIKIHEVTPRKTELQKLKEKEDIYLKEQEEIFSSLSDLY